MNSDRRRFLLLTLGAGGGALLGLAQGSRRGASSAAAAAPAPARMPAGLVAAERSGHALGAKVAIRALHADRSTAQAAADAAWRELETVEALMSIYRPTSEVCRLNRDGVLANPHPYMVQVLTTAQELAAQSDGAFDVTVQPLWALYSAHRKQGGLPSEDEVAAARALADWRKLEVHAGRIRLGAPGMAVTLNGIAQGYAADRVRAALVAHGIEHALIDTGEIGTLGDKGGNAAPWKVGIQHPRAEDEYVALAALQGRCLATSGDYETFFTPDRANNHIFDPKTGHSPRDLSSVTVVADDATRADALSTAVFVAGPERGQALLEAAPGAEALLVRKDGSILATQGFPKA